MRYSIKTIVLAASLLCSLNAAFANVSVRNGNFFIGYTDALLPGGIEPRIERVYNSKSSHDGIFGFGWGSDYEVRLKISADRSLVVYENGGGAQNRFVPPNMTTAEIQAVVKNIMEVKSKEGAGLSGSAAEKERTRLLTDARFRNDEWQKLYEKNLVKPPAVADGTVFKSTKFSYQIITKTKEGYVRKFDNGNIQIFNSYGKLIKLLDKNGNYLNLAYDDQGYLKSIQDNLNRQLQFTFNKRSGKVEKVMGVGGRFCEYRYKGNELVYSKDFDDNIYEFKYSDNGRHNLTEIKYTDKTSLKVSYYPVSQQETVKTVIDRDGTISEYAYGGEGPGGLNYYTTVTLKDAQKKVVSKSRYEYWERAKADGERYTYKMLTDLDGDKTETIYNECCGLPLEITKNGEKTTFAYDGKGHVTKKITPTEVTELAYDPRHGKVIKVVNYPKASKNAKDMRWSQFQYDNKGNLAFAKNSQGKGVRLFYNHLGQIRALADQNKNELRFVYNEANRPVEIIDPKVGKIAVKYNPAGDIQTVDSKGGRKIASQVTNTFQNLLDIIRPAGVTLTF